MDCIHKEWVGIENIGGAYDPENSEWMLKNSISTWDIIQSEEIVSETNEELIEDIVNCIETEEWIQVYRDTDSDTLLHDEWTDFTLTLQYEMRFIIFNDAAKKYVLENASMPNSDPFFPITYLNDKIHSFGMVTYLPANTPIIRARDSKDDISYNDAREMGSKISTKCHSANRMSPVGISMFYGAFSEQIAAKEIKYKQEDYLHIGTFAPLDELLLIDFTKLPYYPSIYEGKDNERIRAKFLYKFSQSLSKPLIDDDFDHISYIPTQVLTEYLRYNFTVGGKYCDGIIYRSSYGYEKCCVLFVDHYHCISKDFTPSYPGRFLKLVDYQVYKPKTFTMV